MLLGRRYKILDSTLAVPYRLSRTSPPISMTALAVPSASRSMHTDQNRFCSELSQSIFLVRFFATASAFLFHTQRTLPRVNACEP